MTDNQAPTATTVARNLDEIIALADTLLDQAINDARATIDGHSLPGGLAMIDLAPVSDPDSWQRRVDLHEHWQLPGPSPAIDADDDTGDGVKTLPVLQVLRWWSEQYRWAVGAVWDHIPTIRTEASFLRHHLDWARTADAARWTHLANDVRDCRTHLENITRAGSRDDRTRVVCDRPTCPTHPRLVRSYAPRYIAAWACVGCGAITPAKQVCDTCGRITPAGTDRTCTATARRQTTTSSECGGRLKPAADTLTCPRPCASTLPLEPVWDSHPEDDRWKCPACKHRYDDDALQRAHAAQLRREEAAKYVALPDARSTLAAQGRAPRTIAKWLGPVLEHVADHCTECGATWPPSEFNACPADLFDPATHELDRCGGELRAAFTGDPEAVIDGYCELKTRRVWVWWPDLWHRHLTTQTRRPTAG
ncbi:hypothetical protein [Nocardioides sp. GY 10127]|uniref:hypothetical protein n=1 Tax=Nocardioides sp. GY 10127 TaxID=2569762 RepID=UPI0010A9171E|nr:hypothetical protein [Nocardioides sp. GY 10127]TIC78805.1 hypothetical protein E8D37_19100 [Nocardioides sp. GY 10127]